MTSERAGQPAQRATWWTSRTWSRPITRPAGPGRSRPAGGLRHLRAPRLEPEDAPSTRRTSSPSPRRSWSTGPGRASPAPCSSARTPTRCPNRPSTPPWRCWPANGVHVLVDARHGYTPTPAASHAILDAQPRPPPATPQADGIVVTPSHNPPGDGGFKYNPPARRPGGHRRHRLDRQPRQRAARETACAGVEADAAGRALAPETTGKLRLPQQLRGRPALGAGPGRHPRGRRPDRRRPDGRGVAWTTGARSASATSWT